MANLKIKKNDTVMIIAGKDKGKTGVVSFVDPKSNRVIVEGLNIVSKSVKPRSAQETGGIVKKSAPIHISNVMLVCPETSKPTRVAIKVEEKDGKIVKTRISKKSNKVIEAGSSDVKKAAKKTEKEASAKKKAVRKTAKVEE